MPVVEIVKGVGAGVQRAARDAAIGVGISVMEELSTSSADKRSQTMVVECAGVISCRSLPAGRCVVENRHQR